MALVTMPTHGVRSIKWTLTRPAQSTRSDWTGTTRLLSIGAPRFTAAVDVRPGNLAHVQAWRAFFAALDGPIGTFYLGMTEKPQGTLGAAAVNGSGQAGSTLALRGLPVSKTVLPAGALITVPVTSTSIQTFMLTAPLVSDASGAGVAAVKPPIRLFFGDGYLVELNSPSAPMRMVEQGLGWTIDLATYTPFAFNCEESF